MITIITSLYNSDKYLKKYAEYIEKFSMYLKNKGVRHEFVIVSNDPNKKELNELSQIKSNSNIDLNIIICPRETLYATWNRGIREAKYENITFWNVDDQRFPEAIIDGLKNIENGSDIVYFPFLYKRYVRILGLKILIKRKVINSIEYRSDLFLKGMYTGPFFIVKRHIFEVVGVFNDSFKIAGDFEWMTRATKKSLLFKYTPTLAGIFTNDGNTLSGQKNSLQKLENKRIVDGIM